MNRIITKLLILSLSIFLAAWLASPTLAHDTSRPGGCNHYYGNGTDDWIACCGPDFCSGNNMVNWCTTCLVGDIASDPTNHSDCFTSDSSCPSGRSACETTLPVTHTTGSSSCDLPPEDPPPASTCSTSTSTFRTSCGFSGQNWCELEQTCSTGWVAGPVKKVVCPASTKLVNTGEYCTENADGTGTKRFTASSATKCEIDSSCNPPRCSSFSLSKTTDIVIGEWIRAYFISAKSTQKNYLYVTNTAVNSVYLIAPNFNSSGSAFDVPTSPGTYKVLINAYDSDCLSFFDWTGNWKRTDVCGSPRYSALSNSGSTGCNANITVRGLTISGTVKLPDGTAYTGGATITLKQGTTIIATTTSSTANGTYSFAGLLIGNYDILLTVPTGYTVTTANPIILTTITSDLTSKDFTISNTPVPTVTTDSATLVTATSATLNSTINPNGSATTAWFRYSSTNPTTCNDTFGTRVPTTGGAAIGSGTAGVADSRTLTSLTTGTTYYFCAIASNTAGTSFGSVLSFTPTSGPDLVINSITTTPTAIITGSNVSISAVVKNQGAGSAGSSSTRLRIDVGNNGIWDVTPANQSTGTLAANGTETETWSSAWTATAGTHRFEVCADAGSAVTESNETNNCLTQTFTVSATAQPDLITQNLAYTTVAAGSTMAFSGVVSNAGSANAGASSARFCIDNASCLTTTTGRVGSADHSISALAANTNSSTITSASWTAAAGSHTIDFCADAGSAVTESNETNNCSSSPFTITAGGGTPTPVPSGLPWIQTTGGDVHSNTRINTPGGP